MDDILRHARENTVKAEHQLPDSQRVSEAQAGTGYKVLFIGNSITRHAPSPGIGWHVDWGMAASEEAKDYVHLTMAGIREHLPDATHRIAQLADWERGYDQTPSPLLRYRDAADWKPNLIVVRIGENVPMALAERCPLTPAFVEMLDFFNPEGRAKVVVTDLFWPVPLKDAAIRAAAAERGYPLVSINELGTRDEMKALGLFEHAGVAAHPGDLGMRAIADALLAVIAPLLAEG